MKTSQTPNCFSHFLSGSLLTVALSLVPIASSQGQTLVSETFDTGVTFTGWNFTGGTIANPPLFGDARNNSSTFNQFFTTSFASTALKVDDTITATFQYNPFSANIRSVRVGLFSGTAASSNGWAQFDNATAPSSTWTGYIGNLAVGSGTDSLASLKGTSGSHPFFGTQTASNSVTQSFSTGSFRAASITLARSDTAILVTLREGANFDSLATVVSYNDTTSAITSFNIFSLFFTTNGTNGDMRYDTVTVTAIPEPSTAAVLIGLTLGVVLLRIHRKRTLRA